MEAYIGAARVEDHYNTGRLDPPDALTTLPRGRFVALRPYSKCVHGIDSEGLQTRIAALALTAAPFAPLLAGRVDHGVDVLMTRPDSVRAILTVPTGSGKTATVLALQAKHSIGGFSVSARALARAARRTEMLWYYTAAHDLAHHRVLRDSEAAPDSPSPFRPTSALSRANLSARAGATQHAPSSASATPPARPAALIIVDAESASLSDRLRKTLWQTNWIERSLIELGHVLSAMAMAARSRFGPSSGPQPTQPPGQIVRTHPCVPRGLDVASRSATSWPSAGVLSVM